MRCTDVLVVLRLVTRGRPLHGKSATDPVTANLLTVFLTVCLCIASRRARLVYCNPASTIPSIFFFISDDKKAMASLNCKLILIQNMLLHNIQLFYTH